MLKRYAVFFSLFRSIIDVLMFGCAWIAVYYVRFHSGVFGTEKGIPDFTEHLLLTLPIIGICYAGCLWAGFYKPKRIESGFRLFTEVLKASVLSGLLVFALFYNLKDVRYSRILLALFIVALFIGLFFSHIFTRTVLRALRRKDYNLRYYAVIGAGKKGQLLV